MVMRISARQPATGTEQTGAHAGAAPHVRRGNACSPPARRDPAGTAQPNTTHKIGFSFLTTDYSPMPPSGTNTKAVVESDAATVPGSVAHVLRCSMYERYNDT